MLRGLLNEPRRVNQGDLLKAIRAIDLYRGKLERVGSKGTPSRAQSGEAIPRLELWALGFQDALNELEESKYCAERFARDVKSQYVEEMNEAENDSYRRYLYFFKNAFIRVFSVLDKLGYFLDELYALRTARVKPRFSYYTVLRNMSRITVKKDLERTLVQLRNKHREPMQRLRSLRNMEIHLHNAEMIDDMMRAKNRTFQSGKQRVENITDNLSDLASGYEMVCLSVQAVFIHAKNSVRS